MPQIANLIPLARLAALADAADLDLLPPAGASPHVVRWDILPAIDDGLVCARLRVDALRVMAMAQDARFLGGSIGANHAAALRRMFELAHDERPDVVLLLVDSGGVRLHEANPAELALARALRSLFDLRGAGVATLAIVTGAAFGGASVLAAACAHLRFVPHARFGLSGPGVIETAQGQAEFDAGDATAVTGLFGAAARVAAGIGAPVDDNASAMRDAIRAAAGNPVRLDATTMDAWDATLAARLAAIGQAPRAAPEARPALAFFADAQPVDANRWLWRMRDSDVHLLRALAPYAFDPAVAVAIATAVREHLPSQAPLVIVEDSPGHATTRAAEMLGVSLYLAAHAARIALLQQDGHAVLGLLTGCGHSAAFFVNALQAATLDVLRAARIEAMVPEAIARVTRLPAEALAALIEGDALLGQPVRHLAAHGGVAVTHRNVSRETLLARVAALR